VVATAILLNGRVAFGALFGICRNPVGCFRVVFTLLQPQLDKHARGRLMVVELTSETEAVTTIAVDGRNDLVKFFLFDCTIDSIDAVGGRTPPKIILVINVRPCKKLMVSVLEVFRDEKFQAL
jgi:hypothetical protein